MNEPQCTECGSKTVKKSSAVYQQGQSTYSGQSAKLGVSSRGTIGVSKGTHSGSRISAVAAANAPPAEPIDRYALFGFAAFGTCLFLGGILNGFFGIIAGAALGLIVLIVSVVFASLQPTSPAFARRQQRYAKQWYCSKCGTKFQWQKGVETERPTCVDLDQVENAPSDPATLPLSAGKPSTWWQRTFGAES